MFAACVWCICSLFFFFKQKTAYEMRISDWSSDVCSSDLADGEAATSPNVLSATDTTKTASLRMNTLPSCGSNGEFFEPAAAQSFLVRNERSPPKAAP